MSKSLRSRAIRLASENKSLRPHLLKVIKSCDAMACGEEADMMGGRTWGNPDPHSTPDDAVPYHSHPDSPSSGEDGSAQRKKYNDWFRKNVCPGHKTNCGDPGLK